MTDRLPFKTGCSGRRWGCGCEGWRPRGCLGGGDPAYVGMRVDLSDIKGRMNSTQRLTGTGREEGEEAHSCVKCFCRMIEYTEVSPTKMVKYLGPALCLEPTLES